MQHDNLQLVRVMMRVRHAMGYFQLGMTQHALACLDAAEKLPPLGPFALVIPVLRAEILGGKRSYEEAAKALELLAEKLPPAYGQPLWAALSMCYRHSGDNERAVQSLAYARGVKPSEGLKADD